MENNNNETIKLTKELLEKTPYFEMKVMMKEHGVDSAFKGGTSKVTIIKSAMKMYADLRTALSGKKEVSEIESFETNEEGDLTVKGIITPSCDKNCAPGCEDCNVDSDKRLESDIQKDIDSTLVLLKCVIPIHRNYYIERLDRFEAELIKHQK